MRRFVLLVCGAMLIAALAHRETIAAESPVTRNLADPAASTWTPTEWNSASGRVAVARDAPREAPGAGDTSIELTVAYAGSGFQFFGIAPARRQIPGRAKRISIWVKAIQPGYSWALKFKDANGNDNIGGKKLEWGLKTEAGKWIRQEFSIPGDWTQPISLEGIAAHNWSKQQVKAEAVLRFRDLRVETDVSQIKDRDSLVAVDAGTQVERNVFLEGEPVRYRVTVDRQPPARGGGLTWPLPARKLEDSAAPCSPSGRCDEGECGGRCRTKHVRQ